MNELAQKERDYQQGINLMKLIVNMPSELSKVSKQILEREKNADIGALKFESSTTEKQGRERVTKLLVKYGVDPLWFKAQQNVELKQYYQDKEAKLNEKAE